MRFNSPTRRRSALCLALALPLIGYASVCAASETATYTYDVLGRLRKTVLSGGPNNGVQAAICLDAAGNRTNYNIALSGGASCSQPLAKAEPRKGVGDPSESAPQVAR